MLMVMLMMAMGNFLKAQDFNVAISVELLYLSILINLNIHGLSVTDVCQVRILSG